MNVYFDSANDWLYVERDGTSTLPVAQPACGQLAQWVLRRPYARALNIDTHATGVGLQAAAWLRYHFAPRLPPAGVCSPTPAGLQPVQTILTWLLRFEAASLCSVEGAVRWLRQLRVPARPGCGGAGAGC